MYILIYTYDIYPFWVLNTKNNNNNLNKEANGQRNAFPLEQWQGLLKNGNIVFFQRHNELIALMLIGRLFQSEGAFSLKVCLPMSFLVNRTKKRKVAECV